MSVNRSVFMIPNTLIQTSINKPDPRLVEKIKSYSTGFDYRHFNDFEALTFFRQNPDNEFKDIVELYFIMDRGAHRADLFRYYYLYKLGGVFLDSDAMLCTQLSNLTKSYHFLTVISSHDMTFQGFIGSAPGGEIIYKALKHCYNSTPEDRKDYHVFCKELRKIVDPCKNLLTVGLYVELGCETVDENNNTILIHYVQDKVIPL